MGPRVRSFYWTYMLWSPMGPDLGMSAGEVMEDSRWAVSGSFPIRRESSGSSEAGCVLLGLRTGEITHVS